MQKSTLDSLLRPSNMSGSENAIVDLVSSQDYLDSPDDLNGHLSIEYDESITDIDISDSIESGAAYPSIFHNQNDKNGIKTAAAKPATDLFAVLNGNRKNKKEPLQSPQIEVSEDVTLHTLNTEENISAIERKVYNPSNRTVCMKDFLSGKPKSSVAPRKETARDMESKIFQNSKKVSARSLLSQPKKSFVVSFKVDKEALKFYKKFENPLKSRGSTQFVRKNTKVVTLKLPPSKLAPFDVTVVDDLPKNHKSTNASSIFALMMKEAASDSVKLTPMQKLKSLDPPVLKSQDFHIFDPNDNIDKNKVTSCLSSLPKRQKTIVHVDEATYYYKQNFEAPQVYAYESYSLQRLDAEHKFFSVCKKWGPLFSHLPPLMFQLGQKQVSWPQLFAPRSIKTLLISDSNKARLGNWINESFEKLDRENFKRQRSLKRKPKKYDGMSSFIVGDDESENEDNSFIPLLIIQGASSTGKSAAVYASMKEVDGYVHEINAGQQRSRRDLLGTLKELCTTQLIHKQGEEKDFQKGIVLLEDCDVLFEQDRTFWTVVTEVLEISRRPVVLTCSDPNVIPHQLYNRAVEDNSVINLDQGRPKSFELFRDYIWCCAFTQGYDISNDVFQNLIQDERDHISSHRKFDIRHMLISCQMLCQSKKTPTAERDSISFVKIKLNKTTETIHKEQSLSDIANELDLLSSIDQIEGCAISQIKHEQIQNELIDVYFIDQTLQLTQPLMPHEKSLMEPMYQALTNNDIKPENEYPKYTKNLGRMYINDFVATRSKPMPAILQGLNALPRSTRSNRSADEYEFWRPEITGIPENSLCIYLPPISFTLDFAPYARNWCLFQAGLDKLEDEIQIQTKSHIRWREFQNKSLLPLKTSPCIKNNNS